MYDPAGGKSQRPSVRHFLKKGSQRATLHGLNAFSHGRGRFTKDHRRHCTEILDELDLWWELTSAHFDDLNKFGDIDEIKITPANRRGSSSENSVTFTEYSMFYKRLAHAVHGKDLEKAAFVKHMHDDFKRDGRGKGFVSHTNFGDSIYEMAILWVSGWLSDVHSGAYIQPTNKRINE
jgi:hypothetical protein